MFIDYHDRINVLVEDPKNMKGNDEKRFLIFRQSKYALEGKQSLAIVGGIIEPGEEAFDAARREVHEELGLFCELKFMGRFRTDVNRGIIVLFSDFQTCAMITSIQIPFFFCSYLL